MEAKKADPANGGAKRGGFDSGAQVWAGKEMWHLGEEVLCAPGPTGQS